MKYLSLTEMAASFGFSRQRLHKLVKQKRVLPPPIRLGKGPLASLMFSEKTRIVSPSDSKH